MTQIGVECIGEQGPAADAEVVSLLAEALRIGGVGAFTLSIATVGVLRSLLDRSGAPAAWRRAVLDAYHASDFVELDRLTALDGAAGVDVSASRLPTPRRCAISFARAGAREAIDAVRAMVAPLGCTDGLDDFERTPDALVAEGLEDRIVVDFSVMSSFDYYTGIRVRGVFPLRGSPLGSGGPLRSHDRCVRDGSSRREVSPSASRMRWRRLRRKRLARTPGRPSLLRGRSLRVAVPKALAQPRRHRVPCLRGP